jgi:hypothetical protein
MELCGAAPREVDFDRLTPRPQAQTAFQRANEVILRVGCIAEAFSGGTATVTSANASLASPCDASLSFPRSCPGAVAVPGLTHRLQAPRAGLHPIDRATRRAKALPPIAATAEAKLNWAPLAEGEPVLLGRHEAPCRGRYIFPTPAEFAVAPSLRGGTTPQGARARSETASSRHRHTEASGGGGKRPSAPAHRPGCRKARNYQ